jgi:inhibitor of the pro-sigma K processing machinery
LSKNNHKNKIRKKEKVIVLEVNSIIVYLACIIFLFLIGKFFIVPLKSIAKIIGNSILGGILIFVINSIGTFFEFHIGLNIGTAIITGILGVPRSCPTNYFKNFYIIRR